MNINVAAEIRIDDALIDDEPFDQTEDLKIEIISIFDVPTRELGPVPTPEP
jgi:hypothetical protein